MIEPLRISFEVACPPEHAFATWTRRISQWWPSSHTVTRRPGLEVVLEGRVGGRIFERTPEGEEHDWGEVTGWDPPRRLAYLWHLRVDPTEATQVAISFVEVGGGSTRVDIEHGGWERLGSEGRARRDANRAGWDGLLPHYAEACRLATAPETS